ncbi:adenylosuccinate lyase [Candidatus Gracilibacteria bacterium]|nr:adenylosuccinate lyase [Candidatus Gracilibacteria bacterium]MCF7819025.1 adenylosuccinate lyase [Candidatus Gracilibacteria bacterium]
MSLSPLDGRYAQKVAELEPIFSEFGLMWARTTVEIEWLLFLSEKKIAPKLDPKKLRTLQVKFGEKEFQAIKKIEAKTNHDVKAVEIFLREYIPKNMWSWIHFGCTSEDINNTAYALLFQKGMGIVLASLDTVMDDILKKAKQWKSVPLLSRTHGQPATPTTMGKEFLVFLSRLEQASSGWVNLPFPAKFSGATGTFAAHVAAFPKVDWISFSQEFVEEKLELDWNPLTTQIEPHDGQALALNELSLASTILIDLCRDIWGYISLGYFGQKVVKGEVGSSTMPHKVNPIDFENAEGNLKLSRGIARVLADELPISRWQRDLTDSTLQRNFGLVFGHFLLGLKSLLKGLGKLEIKKDRLEEDLKNAPEVLTEAVQTVLRAHGHADAYDQLKKFSRGKALSLKEIQKFIDSTDLPKTEKARLKKLTPQTYTGLAEKLVSFFTE